MKHHLLFLIVFIPSILSIAPYENRQAASRNQGDLTQFNIFVRPHLTEKLFKMCEVMTGSEVATLSPFGKPLRKASPISEGLDGYSGCHYELDSADDYPQVKIEVVAHKTASDARLQYEALIESWKDTFERAPDFISGLGDEASFLGEAEPDFCGDCSVVAVSGRYFLSAGFHGYYDEISAGKKKDSAVKLIRLLFQKQPTLKNSM